VARRRIVVAEARRSTRVPELAAAVSVVLGIVFFATGASAQTAGAPAGAELKVDPYEKVRPAATLHLTLDEAVRRAVENNPDLAIVRLGTEVEAARVGESRGAFAPVLSTTLGHSSNATPSTNPEGFSPQFDTSRHLFDATASHDVRLGRIVAFGENDLAGAVGRLSHAVRGSIASRARAKLPA